LLANPLSPMRFALGQTIASALRIHDCLREQTYAEELGHGCNLFPLMVCSRLYATVLQGTKVSFTCPWMLAEAGKLTFDTPSRRYMAEFFLVICNGTR
jgi:hypothetical protein